MNDELDAATTQILNGHTGSEIGTAGFSQPEAGDGDRMGISLRPFQRSDASRVSTEADQS